MIITTRERIGYTLIILTAVLALGTILTQGPIPQDVSYHLFVDTREIWSVPNFWNVVTNIPFAIVGLLGLYKLRTPGKLGILDETGTAYTLLFFGAFLVSFGSSYYHLAPDNQTLVWDRLPMTIAFMALFSIIISEFISLRSGKALLLPLILAGILSVLYWHLSEIQGAGDLRFYALVQFYPMLANIVAKLFEHFDAEVYDLLGFISGHSLKHLTAAMGMYVLLFFYQKRNCNLYSAI